VTRQFLDKKVYHKWSSSE